MQRTDILDRRTEIEQYIAEGKSKSFISVKLHCKPETLNRYLTIMGINYHPDRSWNRGKALVTYKDYVEHGGRDTQAIKKKMLREGLIKKACAMCGVTEWLGQDLSFELHHKDGNKDNVTPKNLVLLCPNCHSLTKNFRRSPSYVAPKCRICGARITKQATLCLHCAAIERHKSGHYSNRHYSSKRPDMATLKCEMEKIHNFSAIGRLHGVSDNAVRKWLKYYGMPVIMSAYDDKRDT